MVTGQRHLLLFFKFLSAHLPHARTFLEGVIPLQERLGCVAHGRVQRCPRPCATLSVAMCNVALGRVQHVSCFPDMRSKGAGMVLGPWEKGERGHYDFNKVCNLASTVGLYSIGQAALIKQLFAMSFCIGSHFLATGIGGYAFSTFAAELVVTS